MRRLLLIAAGLAAAVPVAAAAAPVLLPGAQALRACAAAGPYWPTMTLALRGTTAWVACKEQSRVIRIDTRTGRTLKSIKLDAPVIAVVAGPGPVWALDSRAMLYRIDASSAKVVKRIPLGLRAAYNI